MFDSILSFFFALLGLGVLVIIHEFGHYYMARRCKMKVESFGIGFGKPLFSFKRDGVQFNIGWIPFGGYVKIAGMEKGDKEVPDGFFSKSVWDRISVVFWGPFANVLLAIFLFSLIWIAGGREKTFSEISARVGYVDPKSELYENGVRSGDLIVSYNNRPVTSAKDHLYSAMTSGNQLFVEVQKLGVEKEGKEVRENILVHPYQHPRALEKGILTTGVLAPSSFLIWDSVPGVEPSEAVKTSGIQPLDRIVWVDGHVVFSHAEMSSILNNGSVFATVLRDGAYVELHIPRVSVGELKLTEEVRGELSDWQHESNLHANKLNDLFYIPYNMTSDGVIENGLSFFEDATESHSVGDVLLPHDRIVAINGEKVSNAVEILQSVQEKRALVVVARGENQYERGSLSDEDTLLTKAALSEDLLRLTHSIGTPNEMKESGSFVLLKPILLKTRKELLRASGHEKEDALYTEAERRAIQKIEDASLRKVAENSLMQKDQELFLGLAGVRDATVMYNPSPVAMVTSVAAEMYDTFSALIGGYLSPKWMSGPLGIIHVIQKQWSVGFKEVLFWLGTISLNLALLNLLPLPVLDGGYILISLLEKITGVKIGAATMEKIVWPFAILLIAFLVYLTYNDIIRIVSQLVGSWFSG